MRGVVVRLVNLVQLGDRVAQTAAAREAVRTVGEVAEEAVSLRPHLRREVGIFLVDEIVLAVGQQRHCLDREGQDVAVPLLVEPVHEVLLEPGKGLPLRLAAVRETEVAEHAAEVALVEVADVPEHRLIPTVAGRHIHGMYNLLEVVVDDFHKRPLLGVHLHDVLKVIKIVVTVVLADEVVKVHQELRGRNGSHELGGD